MSISAGAKVEEPVHDLRRRLGDGRDVVIGKPRVGAALVDGAEVAHQKRRARHGRRSEYLDAFQIVFERRRPDGSQHGKTLNTTLPADCIRAPPGARQPAGR
jgi:hypothetical protein